MCALFGIAFDQGFQYQYNFTNIFARKDLMPSRCIAFHLRMIAVSVPETGDLLPIIANLI